MTVRNAYLLLYQELLAVYTIDCLDAIDVILVQAVVTRDSLVVGEHDGALDRRVRQTQRVAKLVHSHCVETQALSCSTQHRKRALLHKPSKAIQNPRITTHHRQSAPSFHHHQSVHLPRCPFQGRKRGPAECPCHRKGTRHCDIPCTRFKHINQTHPIY